MIPADRYELDELDRKILWRLDLDGRHSLTALAEEAGLSKQALNYRMKKLQASGIIKGRIAVIDIHRLGLLTYRLYFRLAGTTSGADRFIEFLKRHKNTLFVGRMSGSWDAEAVFTVRNFIHFNELLKDLRGSYGKQIHRMSLSMTPVVYLFRRDYLKSPTRKFAPIASYGFEPVPNSWDDLDFSILDALSTDCRVTYEDLAEKLGVASVTVKGRIAKLEAEKVISGYRTVIDTSLLGRQYVKALLQLAPLTPKKENEFYIAASRRSFVTYLCEVLGPWQLEIEAEVERMSELDELIGELRAEFPGVIVDFETIVVTEECKLNYLPSGKTTREIVG